MNYMIDMSIHGVLKITFKDLLEVVWKIIDDHENANDIKMILQWEILDSENKCYTGRLGRLVNCLNGYDDRVIIQISDNEQIGQIISVIRRRLLDDDDEEYTIEKHREMAREELILRGYNHEIIENWLKHLE